MSVYERFRFMSVYGPNFENFWSRGTENFENFGRIWSPEFLNSGDTKLWIFRSIFGPEIHGNGDLWERILMSVHEISVDINFENFGRFSDINFENFGRIFEN